MKRNIKINPKTSKSPKQLTKVFSFPNDILPKDGYLSTYAGNVFWAGREAITTGKFHDMFMAGDGHELDDYTDENGCIHPAHAKSIYSSSMLAYNFFYWVSPEHPLTLNGTTFDKVYFEVKFPVLAKSTKGRPINRPSNMDVVLISDDSMTMFCIESKYTEHTHNQAADFADAYFTPSCYYENNPFNPSFIKLALRYNEKKNGYFAGIKQNISHLIGISNIKYDADALAWFKANNPFIEPEVMEKIGANTDIYFTNLLYIHPEKLSEKFSSLKAVHKNYPTLLFFFLFDHLPQEIEGEFMPHSIFNTYPEFFAEVRDQMPEGLADYLDNRYVLTEHPHFPLPDGYDTADHYLVDVVMEGAQKRYGNERLKEDAALINRINLELDTITKAGISFYFLIIWDYVRKTRETKLVGPGRGSAAGSIINYCLYITDVDPLKNGLLFERFFNPERVSLPDIDIDIEDDEPWIDIKKIDDRSKIFGSSHILELRVLSTIKYFLPQLKSILSMDLENIPLDDPQTFRIFQEGDTKDVFQFQSEGMQEYLRELKPDHFSELVALNTMYRPGSMEFIPSYIRRKQGEETITYEFPVMEKYLKETYGLTIYQEQVMMLAQEIASFTPNESDNLRRALSRKSVAELVELHVRFIDGGQKNGYPQKALERIWKEWEKNACYYFNKSHAVCYTLLAYQDAYIKRQLRDGVFGIPSGFKELDEVTGGWHKSDLIVIGARPAVGKTSLMLTMAKEMGIHENPVAIISLEMSNKQLENRLITNVGEIDYEKIKAGKLSKTDEKRLNTKINVLKGLPIYLDDTPSLSIIELTKKAYKLVYKEGVKLIFIDYLQLLSATGMQYNNRAQELSIIIHELKNLAVDLQIPIIAFSQLNRSKEGSNLPQVTDIRESGDIANVADVVCFIHRPKDSDLAQIFVAKDQWGKLGTVELRFKKEYLRFENK